MEQFLIQFHGLFIYSYFHCNISDFAGWSSHDERRDHKSDFEVSEEEKKTRMGSLKKKAIDASTKIRHSLKRTGGRVVVGSFLCLLPARHDDYHMMLRYITIYPVNYDVPFI
jgi:hypothetical protein